MKQASTNDNLKIGFLGIVAMVLATPAVGFSISLNPASDVVPRVFSPNDDGVNDVVFFNVDNPRQSHVSGVIIDMTGARVASLLTVSGNIPTADSLVWNGRDESGNSVPS